VGRRYKIMNPEKMRSTYGKLMFMLQDSSNHSVRRHIGMDVVAPIKTVRSSYRPSRARQFPHIKHRCRCAVDTARTLTMLGRTCRCYLSCAQPTQKQWSTTLTLRLRPMRSRRHCLGLRLMCCGSGKTRPQRRSLQSR
jgi:hypothetical protein